MPAARTQGPRHRLRSNLTRETIRLRLAYGHYLLVQRQHTLCEISQTIRDAKISRALRFASRLCAIALVSVAMTSFGRRPCKRLGKRLGKRSWAAARHLFESIIVIWSIAVPKHRNGALCFCFDAFFSCAPIRTSTEKASKSRSPGFHRGFLSSSVCALGASHTRQCQRSCLASAKANFLGGEFQQLRDQTLRHWITSFRLLTIESFLPGFAPCAKLRG
jgi:hypothetical protein